MNAIMVFYNEEELPYLETIVPGVSFGVNLLHARNGMLFPRNKGSASVTMQPIAFASMSLTSVEICYSNIEREALDILHGLENSTISVLPAEST